MAYPQLGYSYSAAPQFLMTPSSLVGCLDSGGRALVEPMTPPSQSGLSCPVYDSRLLRSPRHDLSSVSGFGGVYSGPYPKNQGYYGTCASDATALYPKGPLDSKDGAASSQTPAYYPYDYTFSQYPYDRYSYSSSDSASRRKNATRETTSTLKAWLQEHQKNPYPTKGEKIMLAIITRMTLTQVSTWFANARRRLKKENKVTWSPRAGKTSEDRDCDDDSDAAEEPIKTGRELNDQSCGDLQSDLEDFDLLELDGSDCEPKPQFPDEDNTTSPTADLSHGHLTCNAETIHGKDRLSPDCPKLTPALNQSNACYPGMDHRGAETKPKIWSIAHTAVSLDPTLQLEYPPCMLASPRVPSPGYLLDVTPTSAERQQDSPVASLRDWVDGVFHDPLFQQRPLTQGLPKATTPWKGLGSSTLESRTLGRSFEHIGSASPL